MPSRTHEERWRTNMQSVSMSTVSLGLKWVDIKLFFHILGVLRSKMPCILWQLNVSVLGSNGTYLHYSELWLQLSKLYLVTGWCCASIDYPSVIIVVPVVKLVELILYLQSLSLVSLQILTDIMMHYWPLSNKRPVMHPISKQLKGSIPMHVFQIQDYVF